MCRRAICGSAVAMLVVALAAASLLEARPRTEAAAPPIGTTLFYAALDCDLATPGIQDTCTMSPTAPSQDVGVVFFNNSPSPYTMGSLALRVVGRGPNLMKAPSPPSPSIDLNPDFNQAGLPGAWACTPTWTHGSVGGLFHGDESIADLTCADAAAIGNVIPANSQVTVAVVHYSLPSVVLDAHAIPIQLGFFATDPAGGNEKGCNSTALDPCYWGTINARATGIQMVIDCDVVASEIQDNCTLAAGAPTTDVAVVLINNSGSSYPLTNFNFDVEDSDPSRLYPPSIGGPINDRNPDLNQASLSATLSCNPPRADTGHGAPGTVESDLSCGESLPGGSTGVADGEELTLATVHYYVPTTASAGLVTLALSGVAFAKSSGEQTSSVTPTVRRRRFVLPHPPRLRKLPRRRDLPLSPSRPPRHPLLRAHRLRSRRQPISTLLSTVISRTQACNQTARIVWETSAKLTWGSCS